MKKYLKKVVANTLEAVSKKTVNSAGCVVWYQPKESDILKKLKCQKRK